MADSYIFVNGTGAVSYTHLDVYKRQCVGGKGMLLWQGVAAFKLYTGQDMPVDDCLLYTSRCV